MELFPDGEHVWLRSRGRAGMYLHAGEDGVGVYLSPRRASLRAAWRVHRVESTDGVPFVLLHGAAYGRYLAATLDPAPHGHIGQRVVQGVYDDQGEDAVAWVPVKVATGDNEVILQHISGNRLLRANGKYCRWRTGVSVDDYFNRTTMMHWVVEAIPGRPLTPQLPPPSPGAPTGSFWNKILGRNTSVVERRMIRFVRAEHDGSFDPSDWRMIEFHGRSVYNLRSAVAENLNEDSAIHIKLCVRAGTLGELTPLVIDLPRNNEPIDIVVVSSFTPFADQQWIPDVDA